VLALLAIDPRRIYRWQRRFKAGGLLALSTPRREPTPISTRVSVQVMMSVFQLPDNTQLLGHDRVKMALDSLGYRDGHATVWQMVALYKQAHLPPRREPRTPNLDERPPQATAPHPVWFADLRSLDKIDGQWLYRTPDLRRLQPRHCRSRVLRAAALLPGSPGLPRGHRPAGRPGAQRE
jgi:transposase InsO family protein